MNKPTLVVGTLLVVAPVLALVPGCGGGDGGGINTPTSTPAPTTSSTSVPTGTGTANPTVTRTPFPAPSFTPTPIRTATPLPAVTQNLTFTQTSDSAFAPVSFQARLDRTTNSSLDALSLSLSGSPNQVSSSLTLLLTNPFQGKVYNAANLSQPARLDVAAEPDPYYYETQSGTITVTSLTATTVKLTFNNVLFTPPSGSTAQGSVTLDGTIDGIYSQS